jgi:SAM-dependent methyltransferase
MCKRERDSACATSYPLRLPDCCVGRSCEMNSIRKTEWFDGDALWRELYLFMFSEKRFTEATEQAPTILSLAKPKGKAILDLCCGPGRFSIPLAKSGFRVTSVDKCRYLLNKARAKASRAGVSIEWICQDMRDFSRPCAFDLALSMFTSFGYFEDRQEDAAVLGNILRSLRPGGSLLIDVMGKEVFARMPQPVMCELLADGSKLVQRPEVVDDWTRLRHEWILIRNGMARSFNFHTTLYSGQELRDLLSRAGFGKVRLYGSLAGEDYGWNAKRLIALAIKPSA